MAKKKENKELSFIDMLMDENNKDNIVLLDSDGKEVEFSQVAVIPLKNKIYAILKPVSKMEGVAEDEALVFLIDVIDDNECLVMVEDDKVIDAVFDGYYDLLRAQGINVEEE